MIKFNPTKEVLRIWCQVGASVLIMFAALAAVGCSGSLPPGAAGLDPRYSYWIDMSGKRVEASPGDVPDALKSELNPLDQLRKANNGVVPDEVEGALEYSDGTAVIFTGSRNDRRAGIVDEAGHWIIAPTLKNASSFSEGLAAVSYAQSPPCEAREKDGSTVTLTGELVQYIDKAGKTVIPPMFTEAYSFKNGLAPARGVDQKTKLLKTGLIDKSGNFVISSEDWGSILECTEGLIGVEVEEKTSSENEAAKGLWGFMDEKGEMKIKPQFDHVLSFSEGLAAVCRGNRWGYIDKEGKVIIPLRYSAASPFTHGMAAVQD